MVPKSTALSLIMEVNEPNVESRYNFRTIIFDMVDGIFERMHLVCLVRSCTVYLLKVPRTCRFTAIEVLL